MKLREMLEQGVRQALVSAQDTGDGEWVVNADGGELLTTVSADGKLWSKTTDGQLGASRRFRVVLEEIV